MTVFEVFARDSVDDKQGAKHGLVPSQGRRKHSTEPGIFGDSAFADQVVIRPGILEAILNQGYGVLWTDIDIVWLGNPLPLFPRVGNPSMVSTLISASSERHVLTSVFLTTPMFLDVAGDATSL